MKGILKDEYPIAEKTEVVVYTSAYFTRLQNLMETMVQDDPE